MVGFLALLPNLLLQLPAGALVDRLDRKRLMLAADAGRLALLLSIGVALWAGRLTLAQVMVVAFLEGGLLVLYRLAETAAIPQVVEPGQLGLALGQSEARTRAAYLAGQPLGGFLFGVERALPFVANAAACVVSFLLVTMIRRPLQADRAEASGRLLREALEGFRWLWRRPFLRVVSLLIAGSNLVFQALVLTLIVVVGERGGSPADVGLVLAAGGLGGVLGSLVAPRVQRLVRLNALVVGAICVWAALLPLVAVADGISELALLFASISIVLPIWNVAVGTYQLSITPEPLLGRVAGAETLLSYGALPLGSLLAGVALSRVGTGWTVASMSIAMGALALVALLSRSIRTHADEP